MSGAFIDGEEIVLGLANDGKPFPATPAIVAVLLRELAPYVALCGGFEIRPLRACPKCGGTASGFQGHVLQEGALVAGIVARIGRCARCGPLAK